MTPTTPSLHQQASRQNSLELATAIKEAIAALPLDRKVRLLTGASAFALHEDETIGLRRIVLSDGPTGVRGEDLTGGGTSLMFPSATNAAATWDRDVLTELGSALAEDALRQDVDVILGPTINLHRSPLGGRVFEAYSEDVLLTGRLAGAYVTGVQARGVGACLKHFVANEAETDRMSVDNVVAQAALREIYLLAFEIALDDDPSWTVMAAYNAINGQYATEHEELVNGVLKGEWNYDGVVMSDWYATKSTGPSANNGLDLIMPGPEGLWGPALVAAVEAGEVPESVVDEHLGRLLTLAHHVGAFRADISGSATGRSDADVQEPDSPARRALLRRNAARGMTVLKGDIVINPEELSASKPLVLVGRHAIQTVLQGGGSAGVRPPVEVSIADGLTAALPVEALRVVDGVGVRLRPAASASTLRDPETGLSGVRVTSFAADGTRIASSIAEDGKHSHIPMLMGEDAEHFGAAVIELTARVVDIDGRNGLHLGVLGDGEWSVTYGESSLFEQVAIAAEGGPGAGVLAPPWHIQTTDTAGGELLRARVVLPKQGMSVYSLIAESSGLQKDAAVPAAANAASDELAVVVVGLTDEQETEGRDKSTLALPGAQDALVSAVAATAARTIVVVNASTPVLMPWADEVDAIVVIGLPGQEGGHAVADVLLGKAEASGRLPTTYPRQDGDGPAWAVTPEGGQLHYDEGVSVGYRGWHQALRDGGGTEPAFWFGHGLGWTTWEYLDLKVSGRESARVRVRNAGERAARELVQLYFEPAGAPIRLVGWAFSPELQPGEETDVEVDFEPRVFQRWDEDASAWAGLGEGRIVVARGLGDIRLGGRL